jgi:hypothetical protein
MSYEFTSFALSFISWNLCVPFSICLQFVYDIHQLWSSLCSSAGKCCIVWWLTGNYTFILCCIFIFLFLHFRERLGHTHTLRYIYMRTHKDADLILWLRAYKLPMACTMLTRQVFTEEIRYVTLGRKFVTHCQKQTEDGIVLEL